MKFFILSMCVAQVIEDDMLEPFDSVLLANFQGIIEGLFSFNIFFFFVVNATYLVVDYGVQSDQLLCYLETQISSF